MRRTALGWVIGGLVILGVIALQVSQMAQFRAELATFRAELEGNQDVSSQAPASAEHTMRPPTGDRTAGLSSRLANLEHAVADLTKASQALMERGLVAPSKDHLAELQNRFLDPAASETDRLRSLRNLKRSNRQLSDEIVTHAMTMLQSSTNGNTRRALLQQLDGVTNAAMKQPLMALLASEPAGNVREELVDVLSDFASDPAIEGKLWQLAISDPDEDVREEAADALSNGPATPERIDLLRQRASNPNATLDERLLALNALSEADAQGAPEVITEFAALAQNPATDPVTRAKLFDAFDGINDPNLMSPLVSGLQDPNPVIREKAADALGSFVSDPRIKEWLNHVIATDTDPRVKREAYENLRRSERRGR